MRLLQFILASTEVNMTNHTWGEPVSVEVVSVTDENVAKKFPEIATIKKTVHVKTCKKCGLELSFYSKELPPAFPDCESYEATKS